MPIKIKHIIITIFRLLFNYLLLLLLTVKKKPHRRLQACTYLQLNTVSFRNPDMQCLNVLMFCFRVWGPAQWTEWSHWGQCSVTCGSGTSRSTRTCIGSGSCSGSSSKTETCQAYLNHCPGKHQLKVICYRKCE